jgi:hypothetical protein
VKTVCICSRCWESKDTEPNTLHRECVGFPEEVKQALPLQFKDLRGQPGVWNKADKFTNIKV